MVLFLEKQIEAASKKSDPMADQGDADMGFGYGDGGGDGSIFDEDREHRWEDDISERPISTRYNKGSIFSSPPPVEGVQCHLYPSKPEKDMRKNIGRVVGFGMSALKPRGVYGRETFAPKSARARYNREKKLFDGMGGGGKPMANWASLSKESKLEWEKKVAVGMEIKFGFYRIDNVTVSETGEEMIHMFVSHYLSRKKAQESKDAFPIFQVGDCVVVSTEKLMTHAFWLSYADVQNSKCAEPLPNFCCYCHKKDDEVDLNYCDGSYAPGNGPCAFPCQLNVACDACFELHLWKNTKSWLCPTCQEAKPDLVSIWGYSIQPPYDGVAHEYDVLPVGAPIEHLPLPESPAAWYKRLHSFSSVVESYEEKRAKAITGEIYNSYVQTGASLHDQGIYLKALTNLERKGYIDLHNELPRDPRTLQNKVFTVDDDPSNVISIDSSGMLQGQRKVYLVAHNLLYCLQDLIRDENVPRESWYWGRGETLHDKDGNELCGGEIHQNQGWREMCRGIPSNVVVLVVAMSGDAVISNRRSKHPVYFTILNVDSAHRHQVTFLGAFLPEIWVRKPHGNPMHGEKLSEEQKKIKLQIMNDAYANLLAQFEVCAREGVRFSFPPNEENPEGYELDVRIRLVLSPSDMEEKPNMTGVNMPYCSRCFDGFQFFGSSQKKHMCCCHPVRGARTVDMSLKLTARWLRDYGIRGLMGQTNAVASKLGMKRFHFKNQLFYLICTFGPWGIFGTIDFDLLHMVYIGLFPMLLSGLDNLMRLHHKKTSQLKDLEDVHQLVESMLLCLPGQWDGLHRGRSFHQGWWSLNSWGGGEYESFFIQILFLFTTNDMLIYDESIRKELAAVIRLTYSIYRKVKMKKYWTKHELIVYEEDILALFERGSALFKDDNHNGDDENFTFDDTVIGNLSKQAAAKKAAACTAARAVEEEVLAAEIAEEAKLDENLPKMNVAALRTWLAAKYLDVTGLKKDLRRRIQDWIYEDRHQKEIKRISISNIAMIIEDEHEDDDDVGSDDDDSVEGENDEKVKVEESRLKSLTIPQLKAELKSMKLPVGGTKPVLIDRILLGLESESLQSADVSDVETWEDDLPEESKPPKKSTLLSEDDEDDVVTVQKLLKGFGFGKPKIHGLSYSLQTIANRGNVEHANTANFEREHIELKQFAFNSAKHGGPKENALVLRNQARARPVALEAKSTKLTPRQIRFQAQLKAQDALQKSVDEDGYFHSENLDFDSFEDPSNLKSKTNSVWTPLKPTDLKAFLKIELHLSCFHADAKVLTQNVKDLVSSLRDVQISARLKLQMNDERLAILLSSGHYVILKNGTVCMFLAGLLQDQQAKAVVLPFQRHTCAIDIRKTGARVQNLSTNKSHSEEGSKKKRCASESSYGQEIDVFLRSTPTHWIGRHPDNFLPWLQRLGRFEVVHSEDIRFKVHTAPAFVIDDECSISEDGVLLNHGINNYNALRNETSPV